jgi:hypothetical protein
LRPAASKAFSALSDGSLRPKGSPNH